MLAYAGEFEIITAKLLEKSVLEKKYKRLDRPTHLYSERMWAIRALTITYIEALV